MSRILKVILAINLIAIAILVFVYPHLMVGPGQLIPGHKQLNVDCFACHAPFAGADSTLCLSCHKAADIGRLTTTGQAIERPLTTTPFHQKLINQDCMACHSDHAGAKRYRIQGRFKHALLQREARDQCQGCHKVPADSLHQQITGNCAQCHSQETWKPATFDHVKLFELDRDHNVSCVTCHLRSDYRNYTCYGCHEHTPEKIRREHIKEGIREYSNCVECHRNADEHDIRGEYGKKGGKQEGKKDRKKGDDD